MDYRISIYIYITSWKRFLPRSIEYDRIWNWFVSPKRTLKRWNSTPVLSTSSLFLKMIGCFFIFQAPQKKSFTESQSFSWSPFQRKFLEHKNRGVAPFHHRTRCDASDLGNLRTLKVEWKKQTKCVLLVTIMGRIMYIPRKPTTIYTEIRWFNGCFPNLQNYIYIEIIRWF